MRARRRSEAHVPAEYFDALFGGSAFDYEATTVDKLGHDDVLWDIRALDWALKTVSV